MRNRLARMLRRTANRLDPTVVNNAHTIPGMHEASEAGRRLAERAIRYAGQNSATRVNGLIETFQAPDLGVNFVKPWALHVAEGIACAAPALPNVAPPKPSLRIRIGDWLELTDLGYVLGLLTYTGAGVVLLCAPLIGSWAWIAAPMVVVAFALCWWFG